MDASALSRWRCSKQQARTSYLVKGSPLSTTLRQLKVIEVLEEFTFVRSLPPSGSHAGCGWTCSAGHVFGVKGSVVNGLELQARWFFGAPRNEI